MPHPDNRQLAAEIRAIINRPPAANLRRIWKSQASLVIAVARQIQSIPAPTFQEAIRARDVETRFRALGLSDISTDDICNVWARTPGSDPSRPALLVSAHLDTVFPAGTDLAIRDEHDGPSYQGRLAGPGLGDNSLGVAGMLALAGLLNDARLGLPADIWWVATVGEEGLGDLRGIRRVCEKLKGNLGLAIILEGVGLAHIFHAGLGVRRLRVDVTAPGGHSWSQSEQPSAIHHMMQIGSQLVERVLPSSQPKSSFNIGLISGGTSINTRAPDARLSIDLRSVDIEALHGLEEQVISVIASIPRPPHVEVSVTVIGDRPAASLSTGHPLVQASVLSLAQVDPSINAELTIGSTDANAPLAHGIPAVCIGLTTGGDAHSLTEYINLSPLPSGLERAWLLTLIAADHTHDWNGWL